MIELSSLPLSSVSRKKSKDTMLFSHALTPKWCLSIMRCMQSLNSTVKRKKNLHTEVTSLGQYAH